MGMTVLGEEKAKKVISILIAATLPGLMRFGKEDRGVKLLFELAELRKFRTIA